MTMAERNNKLKHLITCLKCEVRGKSCDVNCPTQYDAGNMGEIIENLEVISKALEQEPSGDLISRQAVQDYIAKYLSQYLYNDVREAVEVIDEYIGELPSVKQEPKILNTLDFAIDASNGDTNYFVGFRNGLRYAKSLIDGEEPQFESCTEQEPKEGHWINYYCAVTNERWYACSHCRSEVKSKTNTNYCPNCGCAMVEPQESEDAE